MNKVDSDANPFRYCGEYYDKENDSIAIWSKDNKDNIDGSVKIFDAGNQK